MKENKCQNHGFEGLKDCTDFSSVQSKKSVSSEQSVQIRDSDKKCGNLKLNFGIDMKQGWEIKKLGEVCEMYQPKTISTKEMVEDGAYPVFGANGIIGKYDKYNHEEPQLLITCRGATCGSINISEPKSWINGNAMVVRPKDHSIDLKFLEYLFRGGIDLSKTITGAAQPQITRQSLNPIEISYPKSLPEQQHIVSILDECFAAIDKAKANAEQNLKNAKELFESYLQGVFEKKGNGWEEKKLGEVCEIGDGNYSSKYPKASEFVQKGVPFLTATNLKSGTVISVGIRFISKEQHSTLTKGHIKTGDLVIVVRGSSTGNNSLVPENYSGSNLNSQLAYLRTKDSGYLNCDYLFAVFNSPSVMKKVKSEISGAAQPQLPNNKLLDISINIPSFQEQQTIVRQLDVLRAETQKLEAVYQKKIADLEELKKSILQKAFAGKLKTEKAVAV